MIEARPLPAATLPLRPLVVLLVGAGAPPAEEWEAGVRVVACPAESRRLQRLLATLSPSWCVVDESVDDRRVRDLLLEIRRSGSPTRVLMLGFDQDPARCDRWIRRGVQVYLTAGSSAERIVLAMRHADREDTVAIDACFHRRVLALVDRFQPNEDLSSRELEVLTLTSRGLRTEEIATALHLTTHTVNFHLANVTAKLGVRGRTQAVVRGLLLGLIAAVDS
jgi:DNA-binding NarL/FixJ family response regulator